MACESKTQALLMAINLEQKIRGADLIVKTLKKEGVDRIYGIPGGTIMPVYDALYDSDGPRHILTRTEAGATFAAIGDAWMSGRPGVAMVTSGPGELNTFTALANAQRDSMPIVVIAGQVEESVIQREAFQAAPGIEMVKDQICKWAYRITQAGEIPQVLRRALAIAASDRPGSVLLELCRNAQTEIVDLSLLPTNGKEKSLEGSSERNNPYSEVADLVDKAVNPLLVVGHGVTLSGAEEELLAFAEKTGIPIVYSLLGKSAVADNHPLNLGMLGMHGTFAAHNALKRADLVLGAGVRFSDRTIVNPDGLDPNVKVVHINIEAEQIGQRIRADIPIIEDAGKAFAELTKRVSKNDHSDWLNSLKEFNKIQYERTIQKALGNCEKTTCAKLAHTISEETEGRAVVVTDVGVHQMRTALYYESRTTRSFLTSGGFGSMGFGLPAAMGAKIASPESTVVLITGDGSFNMNQNELGTIAEYDLRIPIFISNNKGLGLPRQWQNILFQGHHSETNYGKSPRFDRIAEGYSVAGLKVENPESLQSAVRWALHHEGPCVVDIDVDENEGAFPIIPPGHQDPLFDYS